MKLNYIDIYETPVSVTFVADEIRMINSFFKETEDQISDFDRAIAPIFDRAYAMKEIAETFEEINKKLEECSDARL